MCHCFEPEIQNTKSNSVSTEQGTQKTIQKLNNLTNCYLQREKICEDASILKLFLAAMSAAQQLKYNKSVHPSESNSFNPEF